MKKQFILLGLLICSSILFSQQKTMNEQRAMKESHIDFTKEYIFFTIHGLIEVDGHVFKNDTCKCKIQFQANLDGISIIDTCSKTTYTHRNCGKNNCKIIHLIKKEQEQITPSYPIWRYLNCSIRSME